MFSQTIMIACKTIKKSRLKDASTQFLFIFSRAVFRAEPQLTERTEEANVSLEIVDPRIKGAYSNCFNRMIDFFWLFGGGVIDLVDSLSS